MPDEIKRVYYGVVPHGKPDIKDTAYFYVFKFFEKVKDTGGLE